MRRWSTVGITLALWPSAALLAALPQGDSAVPYTLSREALTNSRPANGFKLVYAQDNKVCDTVLAALNEEGYDARYFNGSDKFTHGLPELLIQTRLNAPRTLIGTHLFRTEEYQIDTDKEGGKEYWYRFIGQGQYLFGKGTGVKKSWMATQGGPYSDFFTFVDNGLPYPDCYYLAEGACFGYRFAQVENLWWIDENKKTAGLTFSEPKWPVVDVLSFSNQYYLISTDTQLIDGESVRIGLTEFNGKQFRKGDAVCFFESTFSLSGGEK